MSTWLDAWRNRGRRRDPSPPIMELVVVAGADAGSQFTLEGEKVLVGRGQPMTGQTEVIRLQDRSISRRQAWIVRDATGTAIESIRTASNPTQVNGEIVDRMRLSVGDRIEMGRVAIEVRARGGLNLSGLTEIMEGAAHEPTQTASASPSQGPTEPIGRPTLLSDEEASCEAPAVGADRLGGGAEPTDVRRMDLVLGELCLIRGADRDIGRRFPIPLAGATIGRSETARVRIDERGVSRRHAEIGVAGRSIVLRQRSETNPTLLNGFPVLDEVELRDGDEIQLADRVALSVHLAAGARAGSDDGASAGSSLSRTMRQKIDLEREIEDFSVMGSFLDVDVVSSRAMKAAGERAEHIIVSFDRFRAFVSGICAEHDGQVLNSNGDELMCFFEEACDAVRAGSAILERLPAFNREQNLLGRDFRFRLGVHTGRSLVDLDAGIAYSEVLDTAGHIQKQAEPDSLLLSQATFECLPEGLPLRRIGPSDGDGGALYRLDGFLSRADLSAPSEDAERDRKRPH